MTYGEIINMPAGFQLDSLIAVSVLGMELVKNDGDAGGEFWIGYFGLTLGQMPKRDLPQFSTDISAAWDVIEHLKTTGYNARIEVHSNVCECIIWSQSMTEHGPFPRTARANTAPLAICRALYLYMATNQ
jgi:hypothetical protein